MLVDYYKARSILDRYKIKSIRSEYVGSADDAVGFLRENKSIVMKVLSQKALHKSRSGLVAVGLESEADVRKTFAGLQKKAARLKPYKMIAQRMVPRGIEIIIGGNVDPQFGRMILLGLGGVYVEAFKDFALRVCPITRRDAASMIDQLRSKSVIAPDSRSTEMIIGLLLKASKMFEESGLAEFDLNPVMLHDGTYDAVDLRMIK